MPILPSFRDTLTSVGPESRAERSQDWIPGSRFLRPGCILKFQPELRPFFVRLRAGDLERQAGEGKA